MTATKPPPPPDPSTAALDTDDSPSSTDGPRTGSGSPTDGPDRAVLELPVDELCLEAPPVDVSLSIGRRGERYRLVARARSGEIGAVRPWLDAVLPGPIEGAHGGERSLLAIARGLPGMLGELVERVRVRRLHLSADGTAKATVVATTDQLERLVDRVGWDDGTVELRALSHADPGGDRLLTDVQKGALEEALRAGFYEVPRRITLSDLAEQLDRSTAGLSTLLRRAERRVVEAYLDDDPFPRRLRTCPGEG